MGENWTFVRVKRTSFWCFPTRLEVLECGTDVLRDADQDRLPPTLCPLPPRSPGAAAARRRPGAGEKVRRQEGDDHGHGRQRPHRRQEGQRRDLRRRWR